MNYKNGGRIKLLDEVETDGGIKGKVSMFADNTCAVIRPKGGGSEIIVPADKLTKIN